MASIGGQGKTFIVLREKTDRGDIDRDWQQIVSLVDKDRDKGSDKETDKRWGKIWRVAVILVAVGQTLLSSALAKSLIRVKDIFYIFDQSHRYIWYIWPESWIYYILDQSLGYIFKPWPSPSLLAQHCLSSPASSRRRTPLPPSTLSGKLSNDSKKTKLQVWLLYYGSLWFFVTIGMSLGGADFKQVAKTG